MVGPEPDEMAAALRALVHKVNNHLASVSGQSQLMGMKLDRACLDPDLADFLDAKIEAIQTTVMRSGAYLARFRWSYGGIPLSGASTLLPDLVTEAIDLLSTRLGEEREFSIDQVPSVQVIADSSHGALALAELIENAVLATSGGGEYSVRFQVTEAALRVEIPDSGRGLDPELVETAFQPFSTYWDEMEQPGLGLYIARTVIEGVGGSVSLASEGPGKGAICVAELPLASGPT